MTIAVLLPEIERWSSFHGGACARVVYETINQKALSEFDFDVYCQSCKTGYAYDYANIQASRFWGKLDQLGRKTSASLDGWMYLIPLYKKLKKATIIHIHNRPHYALILRKMGYKGKIIVHLQNDFHKSAIKFVKEVVDKSDIVISCSQSIADRFFDKYPEGEIKSRIVYNGANDQLFTYAALEGRKDQILFMGRNDPIKGIDNLLDAYEKLISEFPNLQLALTGSSKFGNIENLSPYEKYLRNRIEEINSKGGHIQHLGYLDFEELPRVLQESKVFCLPSIVHDAFPLVVIEAMLSGTPVVASNLGGIPEAIKGHGALAEPNPESLKKSLSDLLNNPEKQKEYSEDAYQYAKHNFTWDKIANSLKIIYLELLQK